MCTQPFQACMLLIETVARHASFSANITTEVAMKLHQLFRFMGESKKCFCKKRSVNFGLRITVFFIRTAHLKDTTCISQTRQITNFYMGRKKHQRSKQTFNEIRTRVIQSRHLHALLVGFTNFQGVLKTCGVLLLHSKTLVRLTVFRWAHPVVARAPNFPENDLSTWLQVDDFIHCVKIRFANQSNRSVSRTKNIILYRLYANDTTKRYSFPSMSCSIHSFSLIHLISSFNKICFA